MNSRAKGRDSERDVEFRLQAAGLSTERALSGRTQVHGDILCEGFAIEVKNREAMSLRSISAAHELSCPPHLTPVVVWRSNRQPWRCSLLLEDFLDLVKEARA